jgi:hypothetical protein
VPAAALAAGGLKLAWDQAPHSLAAVVSTGDGFPSSAVALGDFLVSVGESGVLLGSDAGTKTAAALEAAAAVVGACELRFVRAAHGVIEALQRELDAETAALRSHIQGHVKIKGHLYALVNTAKALRLVEQHGDPEVDARDHAPRSRDQVLVYHIDDKSSSDLPQVSRASSSILERFAISMNGQTSYLWDECNLYCGDQTKSQKDTDAIINEIVLNLLTTMNGEKHCVLVFDCGPLNMNAAVAMALPKLLTELGLFETCGCVFLQLHHSKVEKKLLSSLFY